MGEVPTKPADQIESWKNKYMRVYATLGALYNATSTKSSEKIECTDEERIAVISLYFIFNDAFGESRMYPREIDFKKALFESYGNSHPHDMAVTVENVEDKIIEFLDEMLAKYYAQLSEAPRKFANDNGL